jgi:serine/threonine protein kinase/Tol biopolymer transport system component
MTPERWAHIEELFHRVAECDLARRTSLLDEACGNDLELRRQLQALLSCDGTTGDVQAAVRAELDAIGFPLTGQIVSHYRILDGLGGGGMGLVYRAEDIKLGRLVAVKFLLEESAKDAVALRRFEREARSASALEHPNICSIYEFGEHEGQPFLVMQLLEGQTLRDLIRGTERETPLPLEQLLDLAIQISDGLDAAHGQGIIHRDIKPANIFVTTQGQARILDFGLAKLARVPESSAVQPDPDPDNETKVLKSAMPDLLLSRTGATMGTAGYMSPEQALGRKLDSRTDIFSLGVVLFEMATGSRAFEGDSLVEVRDAVLNRVPLSPHQLNPSLPVEFENIILKAMEKRPELRYQLASEICADLKSVKRDFDSRNAALIPTAPAGGSSARKHARNWLRTWIPVCTFVLAVLAGGFYWVERLSRAAPLLNVRQLTRNSPENSVNSGAISPDGKYLAYSDLAGLHIETLATGETLDVPQPQALMHSQVTWSILAGWLPDSTGFVANANKGTSQFHFNGHDTSIWAVSLLGETRKLRDDSMAFSISPDGLWLAFGTNANGGVLYDHEIWLMRPDGGEPQKIYDAEPNTLITEVVWSPNARRIAYLKTDNSGTVISIESRDLRGRSPTQILRAPSMGLLAGFRWLPGGRIGYSLAKDRSFKTCDHWQMRVDLSSGKPIERPRPVANWFPGCPSYVSFTADGKHFAFVRGIDQYTIYTSDLEANGTRISPPKPLTLSESRNIPSGWTSDSKMVVFISDRNGPMEIFRQPVDAKAAQRIFTGQAITGAARLSPDGTEILYVAADRSEQRLMRIHVVGGAQQEIMSGHFVDGSARCARLPATACVIAEESPDRKHLIFTSIDSLSRRGRELSRIDSDPARILEFHWALSPDGARLAVLTSADARIHILSLAGQPLYEIALDGWPRLGYVSWTSDGKGLIVGSQKNHDAVLLNVDLEGKVNLLWEQHGAYGVSGVPSPDGRHIAIWLWTTNNNIWMADNP